MSERGHGYIADPVEYIDDDTCDFCLEGMDLDCWGEPRCASCDEPCPGCYSGIPPHPTPPHPTPLTQRYNDELP